MSTALRASVGRVAAITGSQARSVTTKTRQAAPGSPVATIFHPHRSAKNPRIFLPKGLVYNPPPSAPSPYQTPAAFLPKSEKRVHVKDAQEYDVSKIPALHEPKQGVQKYHLSEADILEMQRLRESEPQTWSTKRLAEKFGCSTFVVMACTEPPAEHRREMLGRLDTIKSKWTKKKQKVMRDRQARKSFWLADAL